MPQWGHRIYRGRRWDDCRRCGRWCSATKLPRHRRDGSPSSLPYQRDICPSLAAWSRHRLIQCRGIIPRPRPWRDIPFREPWEDCREEEPTVATSWKNKKTTNRKVILWVVKLSCGPILLVQTILFKNKNKYKYKTKYAFKYRHFWINL